ncbi:MAG: hypothetical protein HY809_04375 [Nitrospirae bacterium]|nr:hypothetical protein [Nitrospirota bacterium]
MIDEQKEQEAMHYCLYLVAFFDILGQRDKMSKIAIPPSQEDADTVDSFKQDILQIYRNVMTLRKLFTDTLKSFRQSGIEDNKISEATKLLINKFREHPITNRSFADSVIVYIRLKDDEMQYAGEAIYGVLSAAAITFQTCMANGVPIRGGIDLGYAMNIERDEIYGPVLASAYYLESKVAKYPRIVVGQHLVSYLKEQSDSVPKTDVEQAGRQFAKNCQSIITADYDGNMIVDHIGDYMRNHLQKISTVSAVIADAYKFISTEYEKYRHAQREAKNSGKAISSKRYTELADRYELLKKYFEKHLPAWGMK